MGGPGPPPGYAYVQYCTSCGIVARVSGGIINIFSIEFSW